MGPNAYNVIAGAGIKIYRAGNVSLEKAVQLYKEAKLEAIAEAGASHFGMGQGPRGGV
jgi:predicted Fe-Mo cluster-binding NifX family protein